MCNSVYTNRLYSLCITPKDLEKLVSEIVIMLTVEVFKVVGFWVWINLCHHTRTLFDCLDSNLKKLAFCFIFFSKRNLETKHFSSLWLKLQCFFSGKKFVSNLENVLAKIIWIPEIVVWIAKKWLIFKNRADLVFVLWFCEVAGSGYRPRRREIVDALLTFITLKSFNLNHGCFILLLLLIQSSFSGGVSQSSRDN